MNTSLREPVAIRRVAGGLALATLVMLVLALYPARQTALDKLLSKHLPPTQNTRTQTVSASIDKKPSRATLKRLAPNSTWDPNSRYLVYLPFEGISNQFYSLQNAAVLAKRLNRTLVVPPITSNRHDRLGTNQPWSRYMDLKRMAQQTGIQLVEWQTIKPIDPSIWQFIEPGSRTHLTPTWRAMAEPLRCQVIRNFGHEHFVGEEDSIGADFAYQFLLNLQPIPVPGHGLDDNVAFSGDIIDSNQNSTEPIVCLTFTFTVQNERDKNRWDMSFQEAGQYARFLPRFASYVEDLVSYRFGLLDSHVHPHPPIDLGISILDKGEQAATFLSRKPPSQDYIAIHLRRGDIEIKCLNRTTNDCIIPVSVYKEHVDAIMADLPVNTERPHVVLVSDTQSDAEKKEIDSYGWYRLDHTLDPNLLDASRVLGPFSPAMIDSAVLTGRGARWVIGSRRSTMSWLAAMRISSWYNQTILYPKETTQQKDSQHTNHQRIRLEIDPDEERDDVVTWIRSEQRFFDELAF
ncbi:hypothetical protein BGZ94_007695 [Podila epigama]|nr:hypothetical protein BGZ94_007695 [Podila epigama]